MIHLKFSTQIDTITFLRDFQEKINVGTTKFSFFGESTWADLIKKGPKKKFSSLQLI
jgi:hypothetical protein